jgi:DNA primase
VYSQELIDKVRAAVDIAEVVGEHVPLRKAGANSMKGLCPFHKEKTPSFHVNTARQIFKCFGCGAGGNAATFLMRIENIPFPEAIRRLAERARIPLPTSDTPEEQERRRLLQVCETAATLYRRSLAGLPEARAAREHLAKRRIPAEAAEKFRIGYSSGREIFSAKLHPALLARAGLASMGSDGTYHDRLRGRIILPITDESGRVIGFGGRAMSPDALPKYMNTPDTPLYHKSSVLYGLSFAKEALRRSGRAILVEGYFDAIGAHAAGVTGTVAVLGTSLTEQQLKLLRRFVQKLVIVYDEDAGGNEAALRGLDLATEAGFDVRIARLPGSTDPDEFILANGADRFLGAMDDAVGGDAPGGAVPLFDFRLEVAARRVDIGTLDGKKRTVDSLLPFLARVPNAIERHANLQRLADRLGLREADIEEELGKFREKRAPEPAARPRAGGAAPVPEGPKASPAERMLLAGVLGHGEAAVSALLGSPPEVFRSPAGRKLADRLRALFQEGSAFSVSSLMDDFQDSPEVLDMLASSGEGVPAAEGPRAGPDEAACREAASKLNRQYVRDRLREVQRELEKARDPADVTRLLREKQRLAALT